ncbi:MAG: TonB family protein [candidate division WOR-3 bacterium]|nr:MAG: TonB family protein [candidate division WOR-3 bacterium]
MRCLLVFLTILSIGFISCAEEEDRFVGEQGGKLVIGTMELPVRIDPLEPSIFSSGEIMELLFLRLHGIDKKTGKMKPMLAESWEFSEDLKSVTYFLRRNVTWWDGQPVTAHDVLYTYQQMKDPSKNYPNVNSLRFITDVQVLNDHTIKFTFEKVYSDILTDSDIMPVPKHVYVQAGAGFGAEPVGNGPYKISEWVQGSGMVLSANEEYYRGRPPLDEIIIRYYSSTRQMIDDFQNGVVDLIFNIAPTAANELSGNDNVSIISEPGNSYLYVAWNLNHPFLQDREVRRALAMAIDRQRILRDIYGGMGEICLGPLPPSSWGYDGTVDPIPYNVDGARSILQNKGFGDYNRNRTIDLNRTDFTVRIITNSENPDRVAILRYISEDLQRIGVRVVSQTVDANTFVSALVDQQFDGYIMGWRVGDKIDPGVYWHSRGRYNFASYTNPFVDSLIDSGVAMLDRKKARNIWNEFQKTVYEDQPYAFLVVPDQIAATYKRVKGVENEVKLVNAQSYWIPEAERRVGIAALSSALESSPTSTERSTPTGLATEEVATEGEESPSVEPEMILEATAQSDTTVGDTITTVALSVPPPPKPSIITRAEPVSRVQPRYPAAALEFQASGTVVVRVLVGTDGRVKEAAILNSFGNPACEQAALDAARRWEFTPATKDGTPFEQRVSIPFTFSPQ